MKQSGETPQRLAPRTVTNLRRLNTLDPEFDGGLPRLVSYERELRELRREIDELRRTTGGLLSCTTSFPVGPRECGDPECVLLTQMLLELSSESPT